MVLWALGVKFAEPPKLSALRATSGVVGGGEGSRARHPGGVPRRPSPQNCLLPSEKQDKGQNRCDPQIAGLFLVKASSEEGAS